MGLGKLDFRLWISCIPESSEGKTKMNVLPGCEC